jgi:hypothetical protein
VVLAKEEAQEADNEFGALGTKLEVQVEPRGGKCGNAALKGHQFRSEG